MRIGPLFPLCVVLLLAGCAAPRALDGPAMALTGDEAQAVRTQVERARANQRWTAAWNQAVDLGGDRDLFEGIAMDAVADEDGASADMLAALRAKWGGLSPAVRARFDGLVAAAVEEEDWVRAVDLRILGAEDAPTYARAWELYRDESLPPAEAPKVLDRIREAREDDGGGKGDG